MVNSLKILKFFKWAVLGELPDRDSPEPSTPGQGGAWGAMI